MKKLLLILLLSLGLFGSSYADTKTETECSNLIISSDKAFKESKYNTAFEDYYKLFGKCYSISNQKIPYSKAMLNLAWMLENGKGTFTSPVKALEVYGSVLDEPETYDEYMLTTAVLTKAIPLLFRLESNGNITEEDFNEALEETIEFMWGLYIGNENVPDFDKKIIRELWEKHNLWLFENYEF
jgi:hypothetical protein